MKKIILNTVFLLSLNGLMAQTNEQNPSGSPKTPAQSNQPVQPNQPRMIPQQNPNQPPANRMPPRMNEMQNRMQGQLSKSDVENFFGNVPKEEWGQLQIKSSETSPSGSDNKSEYKSKAFDVILGEKSLTIKHTLSEKKIGYKLIPYDKIISIDIEAGSNNITISLD